MTILEMIAEWRKGCSCASAGKPEECPECTRALIDAIEKKAKMEHLPSHTCHDFSSFSGEEFHGGIPRKAVEAIVKEDWPRAAAPRPANLPYTCDGVPIELGMTLYRKDEDGEIRSTTVDKMDGIFGQDWEIYHFNGQGEPDYNIGVHHGYCSTPEAAAAWQGYSQSLAQAMPDLIQASVDVMRKIAGVWTA